MRRLFVTTLAALLWVGRSVGAPPETTELPSGWWRDATFYEIFVRSFADAKAGPLAGDGVGDLQGLIDHLDYLNDGRGAEGHSLGVNAVWLMPTQPSPSYHGYDVTDYFGVNPQYGDVALMKQFVQAAHQHGIRVIIDLVLNHCSSRHPFFVRALTGANDPQTRAVRQMFRFADLPENLSGPWGQRVWHPNRDEFYYGVFTSEMPDWNFRDPAVTEHHHKVADFWLREVGVDGFRLDAVRYFVETGEVLQDTDETRRWLRDFTAYCHQVKPGSFVVGENTADMREVAQWIRSEALDSSFEFDLAKATLEAIRLQTPGILTRAEHQLDRLYENDSPWASFLSNHDQERVITQLDGNPAETRLAAELLFTLPGATFIYYAEELGMPGAKPDPDLRTPMPWTAETPNAGFTTATAKPWHPLTITPAQLNVASETADPNSMLTLYRKLIRLRNETPSLRHGAPVAVSGSDRRTYAAMRETSDEVTLVLANFTGSARPAPELSLPQSRIRANWAVTEALGDAKITPPTWSADGGFKHWRPLATLAPETAYVIRWRKN